MNDTNITNFYASAQTQQIIFSLFNTFLIPVIAALALFIVRFLRAKIKELEASKYSNIMFAVESQVMMLVKAAEQSGAAGLISSVGEDKKKWVEKQVVDFLNIHGFDTITTEQVSAFIEAALFEIKKSVDNG